MQAYFEFKDNTNPEILVIYKTNNFFPAHFHQNLELIYCKKGEIEITINENKYLCKAGDFCIAQSLDIHSYYTPIYSE